MKNKIKVIRQRKGMQQKELALAANISQPYLYDLENGARGAKESTLQRIADVLGVSVDDLFDRKAG